MLPSHQAPHIAGGARLRRRSFGLSSVITCAGGFSLYALMVVLPLFYRQIGGEPALVTGLPLIPQGIGTVCFILLNHRLTGRIDTRLTIAGGAILTMIDVFPSPSPTPVGAICCS